MIKVVNKYTHKKNINSTDKYVGRPNVLSNPFTSKTLGQTLAKYQCKDRDESVAKYEEYLLAALKDGNKAIKDEMNLIYQMAQKGDVNLICFCHPKKCHADVIKKMIDSKIPKV